MVPWSTFWERNYFAHWIPLLRQILANDFVRGAVSGLGLVNLAAGLVDLASVVSIRRAADPNAPAAGRSIGSGVVDGQ